MGDQPTIKDVAKLAGVSISTVSRVMNDSKPVSPEARRKVLDAINKLDFKPNELARSLVMKKSNLIGVIVKDIGIEYMSHLVRGIEEIGRLYKYDIILSSTYGDEEIERRTINFLVTKQVEGIIYISEDISPEVLVELKETKTPFILLDRYYDFKNLNTVKVDYADEEYKLIKYLNSLGHKNIAFMNDSTGGIVSSEKLKGYEKAAEEFDFQSLVFEAKGPTSDDGYELGADAVESFKEGKFTAISCASDELAVGFISRATSEGVKVPEDISVTGFEDSSVAEIFRPKITTSQVPYYDIGAIAIRALIKRIRQEEDILENDRILDDQIIERQSSSKIQL